MRLTVKKNQSSKIAHFLQQGCCTLERNNRHGLDKGEEDDSLIDLDVCREFLKSVSAIMSARRKPVGRRPGVCV